MLFFLNPRRWFLSKKELELEKIKFFYKGYELKKKTLEYQLEYNIISRSEYNYGINDIDLEFDKISLYEYNINIANLDRDAYKISPEEYTKRVLDIKLQFFQISEMDYKYSVLNLEYPNDTIEKQEKKLSIDLELGVIQKDDFDKEMASLHHEPWVTVKYIRTTPGTFGNKFEIEIDYNDFFIEELRTNGWPGKTEDEMVSIWFNETCRQIGDQPEELNSSRNKTGTKKVTDDSGFTGYI